ncbi:MAG: hypothetical protein AB2A00_12425 [Myxococcota bacterium]
MDTDRNGHFILPPLLTEEELRAHEMRLKRKAARAGTLPYLRLVPSWDGAEPDKPSGER